MLKNYLTISIRNLLRHKGFAFINITGLAIGIACCMLILLFVRDEISYDRFHEKADQIYRVVLDANISNSPLVAPVTPAPMAFTLVDEYPEVENASRLFTFAGEVLVKKNDQVFIEERFYFADSTFFDIFTFPFLEGNPKTALVEPNSLVITETMAEKYFADEAALDQYLVVGDTTQYKITGVTADVPENSHFHFDFLSSLSGLPMAQNQFWVSNNFSTYILLQRDFPPEQLEAKFLDLMRNYAGPQIQQFMNQSFDEFRESGSKLDYILQPITDIHLHSHMEYEIEANSNIAYVILFSAVALFILLIACINFMNLSTARSADRAREVGMRKVLGSERSQLIRQFLSESIFLTLIALIFAVVVIYLVLPFFNTLAGKNIQTDFMTNPTFIVGIFVSTIVVGVLAGSYPSFFLASYKPINVLKGEFRSTSAGKLLRSGLVVFQFAISIILIVGTFVVFNQLSYVQNSDVGFDKNNMIVISRAQVLGQQTKAFKDELRAYSGVINASSTLAVPGGTFGQTAYQPEGGLADVSYIMAPLFADYDFVETMDIQIGEGRDFSRDFLSDSAAFIINEAAVTKLEWDQPIGQKLRFLGAQQPTASEIIGVMEDWNYASLHQDVGPLVLGFLDENSPMNFLVIRIRPDDIPGSLSFIEQKWMEFVPEQPFLYSFLEDDLNDLYNGEEQLGNIFRTFALITILIACLGLFGLASFTAQQRTKEIGIRKAMGASLGSIVYMLSKNFTTLVAIAFVVAVPVAYFGMNRWLQDFAYRTTLSPWIFAVAGVLALIIAWLTVSYQSVKAAMTNPVNALRYE